MLQWKLAGETIWLSGHHITQNKLATVLYISNFNDQATKDKLNKVTPVMEATDRLQWRTELHFMPKLTCSMSASVDCLILLRPRANLNELINEYFILNSSIQKKKKTKFKGPTPSTTAKVYCTIYTPHFFFAVGKDFNTSSMSNTNSNFISWPNSKGFTTSKNQVQMNCTDFKQELENAISREKPEKKKKEKKSS